ncbi:MAG: PilZ domain-containing protein [Candidatus Eremiobacterota bacterium]
MLSWLGPPSAAALAERRKLARRECYCEVMCYLREEGALVDRSFKGLVTDIGVGGMRVRSYEAMPPGSAIAVEFQEHLQGVWVNKVQCSVVWSYKSKAKMETFAGVTYSDAKDMMKLSWVKFVLEDVGFTPDLMHERRATIRVRTRLAARLYAHAADLGVEMEAAGTVRNLSLGGLMVEAVDPILEGRRVDITLDSGKGLKLPGTVRSVLSSRATSRFSHCIAFEPLAAAQEKALRAAVHKALKAP